MDDALLKSLGDEAVGVISAAWYSADRDTPSNKRFVAAMQKDYGVLPGGYSAGMYVAGQCVEAAHRRSSAARPTTARRSPRRCTRCRSTDTPRGAVKFDQYGNVVGDVFIRRCERKDGRLVNTVIKTYPERQPVLDLQREGVPGATRSTRATTRRPRTWRTSERLGHATGNARNGSVRCLACDDGIEMTRMSCG